MLDLKKIELRAGNGGNGSVSFIREALLPKGGPGGERFAKRLHGDD